MGYATLAGLTPQSTRHLSGDDESQTTQAFDPLVRGLATALEFPGYSEMVHRRAVPAGPVVRLQKSRRSDERHMPTVQSLISAGTPVRWHCSTCSASGHADLSAIALAKGVDFDLTDCTPRCRVPDCLGLVWFSVPIGAWHEKLLTATGKMRLEQHGDWVFAERLRRRRAAAPLEGQSPPMREAPRG